MYISKKVAVSHVVRLKRLGLVDIRTGRLVRTLRGEKGGMDGWRDSSMAARFRT